MTVYEFKEYLIRPWTTKDRQQVADIIRDILTQDGQKFDASPRGADYDALNVEECYESKGGIFFVIQRKGDGKVVGTGAFYPLEQRGKSAAEIRKLYLLPEVRDSNGVGLYMLQLLEDEITKHGFTDVWIQTGSGFKDADVMYETNGYRLAPDFQQLTVKNRNDKTFFKHLGRSP